MPFKPSELKIKKKKIQKLVILYKKSLDEYVVKFVKYYIIALEELKKQLKRPIESYFRINILLILCTYFEVPHDPI